MFKSKPTTEAAKATNPEAHHSKVQGKAHSTANQAHKSSVKNMPKALYVAGGPMC